MPADHCCRLDNHQGVGAIRPEAGDQNPEPAIGWLQSWSGRLSVQHSQLLASYQTFEISASQRPIKPLQKGYEQQDEQLGMAERLSGRWPDSQGSCGLRRFDEPWGV
jgi:hypothetical protein